MFMIGQGRRRDAVDREKVASNAGVLAGDDIDAAQNIQGAGRNIAGIADRRGDDMQPCRWAAFSGPFTSPFGVVRLARLFPISGARNCAGLRFFPWFLWVFLGYPPHR